MNFLQKSTLFIILTLYIQVANSSGQRSTFITLHDIESFQEFKLNENMTEKYLHYVGTVGNKVHLLMVTKSVSSRDSSGRLGMPWSHVIKYKTPVNKMTIINGWDLTNKIKEDEIEISPSYCPRLYLSAKKKKYIITTDTRMNSGCFN